MAQIFAAFGKFSSNNKGSVQNFGIVGITIASEEITKFIFFYCPCNILEARYYGSTFIFGPAVILLVVGYLVNRRTWRLTTGLCNRTQGVGKGCKRVFHFLFIFANITSKALIAPCTWLVISLLKGDYYACAHWPANTKEARDYFNLPQNNKTLPLPCLFQAPAKFLPSDEAFVIARDLRATSHLIGWWFVAIALMFGVIVMFILRCWSKYSYEQAKYITAYRKHEVDLFEETLDAKAKEQAKRIVDGYFVRPRKKEEWDQIAVINDKVTKSKRGRPIYSPMHKFVHKELLLQAEADGTAPADAGLVGDAAEKKRSAAKRAKAAAAANNAQPSNGGNQAGGIQMMPMVVTRSGGRTTQNVAPASTGPVATVQEPPSGDIPSREGAGGQPADAPANTSPSVESAPINQPASVVILPAGTQVVQIGQANPQPTDFKAEDEEVPPDPIKETNLLDPEDSSGEEDVDGGATEPPHQNVQDDYSTEQGGDDQPLL